MSEATAKESEGRKHTVARESVGGPKNPGILCSCRRGYAMASIGCCFCNTTCNCHLLISSLSFSNVATQL